MFPPSRTQGHMGGSPDLHAPPPAPSVGVYSSVSSKKKMRINADAAQRSATAIRFVPNVMLLEAAARNDVEEGTWVRLCPANTRLCFFAIDICISGRVNYPYNPSQIFVAI